MSFLSTFLVYDFFLNDVKRAFRVSGISLYIRESLFSSDIFQKKNHKSENIERGYIKIGKKVRNRLKLKVTKFENLKMRPKGAF